MSRGKAVESVPDATPADIPARAAALDDRTHKLKTKHRPAVRLGEDGLYGHGQGRDDNRPSNEFPVKISAVDEDDTIEEMKTDLIKAGPDGRGTAGVGPNGYTPYGQAVLENRDIAYLYRKRQQAQLADYEKYIANRYNLKDPPTAMWFESIVPRYFQDRLAQIHEVAVLQEKIANLRLLGPQSEDDLWMEWALLNGVVQLPKGAVWDPDNWYDTKDQQELYVRGLFNPRRYFAPTWRNPASRHDVTSQDVASPSWSGGSARGTDGQFGNTTVPRSFTQPNFSNIAGTPQSLLSGSKFHNVPRLAA